MAEAQWILHLCERFGCLPSTLYDEDSDLLVLLDIERLAREVTNGQQG